MTRDGYCTTASGARWMRDRRERAKPEPISSSGSRSSWTIRRHVYGKVLSDVGERHKRNNRPRRPRGRLSFGSPILKKEQSEERTRVLFLIAMTVSAVLAAESYDGFGTALLWRSSRKQQAPSWSLSRHEPRNRYRPSSCRRRLCKMSVDVARVASPRIPACARLLARVPPRRVNILSSLEDTPPEPCTLRP
jgi:hypothetical protein